MLPIISLTALISLIELVTAETLLGAYIFHRHGDRTSKSTPPTNLTGLGYQQIFTSGAYFRDRYVSSLSSNKIAGLSSDQVKLSQLQISAPVDNVLMNSATAFSQALYPATQQTSSETLRNGTKVQTPLDGYQLIPIGTVSDTGSNAEDGGWLQASTNCGAAITSSNAYFQTAEYQSLLSSTQAFYSRLSPLLNLTFSPSQISFKNAYTIYDLLNVAEIHNVSIPSSELLDPDTSFQLRTLADTHEWNLAYNTTSNIRAIAGMQLAAEVTEFFEDITKSNSQPKLGVQFGNYATMLSYFGLADLSNVRAAPGKNDNFQGVPDYASAVVWELFTNSDNPTFPVPAEDLTVRFLWHNGTSSNISEPQYYPLFNGSADGMPWGDFLERSGNISVGTTQEWCEACGNSTGSCAQYVNNSQGAAGPQSGVSPSNNRTGMSNAVAGVIGAFVTLGVVLLAAIAMLLLGGLRIVSKKRRAPSDTVRGDEGSDPKQLEQKNHAKA